MLLVGLSAHRHDVAHVDRADFPERFQLLRDASVVDGQLRRGGKFPLPPFRGLREVAAFLSLGHGIADDPLGSVKQQVLPILNRPLRHGYLSALRCAAPGTVAVIKRIRPVQSSIRGFEQAVVEVEKRIAGAVVDQRLDLAARVGFEVSHRAAIEGLDDHLVVVARNAGQLRVWIIEVWPTVVVVFDQADG